MQLSFSEGMAQMCFTALGVYVQRMLDHNRELANTRQRESERLRHELDAAQRRAKIAEDDNVQKQAVVAHNNKQVCGRVRLAYACLVHCLTNLGKFV